MTKLGDGAFTGSKNRGNPYTGDLEKGISYDVYEANFPSILEREDFPVIVHGYRGNAEKLIQYFSSVGKGKIMDIGSGTGIATLELLSQNKAEEVTGLEMSEGMLLVAKYKFHKTKGKELISRVKDPKLLEYWNDFRAESFQYKGRVRFIQGDVQECLGINPESMDGAIANQVMHWTDLTKSFGKLSEVLKKGSEFIWNSASHFYNDTRFPAARYGFRYNSFLAKVIEKVCSDGGYSCRDYTSLSKPRFNFDMINEITKKEGFTTTQIGTKLEHVDLQTFVQNHVPIFVRQLVDPEVNPEELEARIKEGIAKSILDPDALSDTNHKYDIVPIFRSVRNN